MSNFNLDNAGSGFALDDDDDLNELLDEANALGEPLDEEDTSDYFNGIDTDEAPDRVSSVSHKTPREELKVEEPAVSVASNVFEPEPEPEPEQQHIHQEHTEHVLEQDDSIFKTPDYSSFESDNAVVENTIVEPQPDLQYSDDLFKPEDSFIQEYEPQQIETSIIETTPEPTPAPVVEETPVSTTHTYTPPRLKVPSIADDLEKVRQVVNILDAYRALNNDEKTVAGQFISGGEEVNNEPEFIVKVLNVDPMLEITMKALKDAKSLDDVERSFFVIELDEDVLYSLGSLVSVFTGEDNDKKDKRQYARKLVRDIDLLDTKSMNFVTATESVLVAAKEGKN